MRNALGIQKQPGREGTFALTPEWSGPEGILLEVRPTVAVGIRRGIRQFRGRIAPEKTCPPLGKGGAPPVEINIPGLTASRQHLGRSGPIEVTPTDRMLPQSGSVVGPGIRPIQHSGRDIEHQAVGRIETGVEGFHHRVGDPKRPGIERRQRTTMDPPIITIDPIPCRRARRRKRPRSRRRRPRWKRCRR